MGGNELDENTIINHYSELYLVKKDEIDLNIIKMQGTEVEEIKLVNSNEFIKMLENDETVKGAQYCKEIIKYM